MGVAAGRPQFPGGMIQLWRSISATAGARAYSLLAGVGVLVITSRALGPTGRGELAAAITWAMTFSTIMYLSLGQVALHKAAEGEDNAWLRPTLGALTGITVLVTVIGWLVAGATYLVSDGALYGNLPPLVFGLGMAALPFLVWEQYGSSLLTAVGQLSIYNRAQLVGRTLGLVVTVVLVIALGLGVAGALVAILLGQACVALAGARRLIMLAGGRLRVSGATARSLLSGGVKLHLNAVGTFLFTNASVLLVQYYRGATETGYFQVAVQLMSIALIVPHGASMVLYGEVARDGPDGAWAVNKRVLLLTAAAMAGFGAVGAMLAPWLLPLVLGDEFRPAVPIFQLLALAVVGQTCGMVMAPQWIGRGLFWQASLAAIAVGLLHVGVGVVLIPRYGMYGAAWAIVGVSGATVATSAVLGILIERGAPIVRRRTTNTRGQPSPVDRG